MNFFIENPARPENLSHAVARGPGGGWPPSQAHGAKNEQDFHDFEQDLHDLHDLQD